MGNLKWIDCIDMPEALSYEEIKKSSFRHKETLMPVLAISFDSSYGAIKNHDGEYILMEDLQYLVNEDDLLTPDEYAEKYYTHQSNDGASVEGVEKGRQMQAETMHPTVSTVVLNCNLPEGTKVTANLISTDLTEEITSHEEAEEFIQNWLKSRNHSYGYGIKIDCETVVKIMQEYAQSQTSHLQEELKKSRSKITELVGEISDLKDVINPARVTSKKSSSMD